METPELLLYAHSAAWREEMERRRAEHERRERDAYAAVTDPRVIAVLDVLAPLEDGDRSPIFEWGQETTPDAGEMIELATRIAAAL